MNNNLALQKHTLYEYQKPKHIKKTKSRAHKNNFLYSIITTMLIIISPYFIAHDFYISLNSRDLYFAVEYNFTNYYDNNNCLLRVQHMTLISSNGKTAIVEASGLSKSSPHHTILIRGSFDKDNDDIWRFNEITKQ